MPLYVADYLADTGHLSTAEHGAYMLLIMHYWQANGLPDDDKKLARICRMTPDEWSESRDTLAGLFDDGWSHGRIDEEIARAEEKYRKRAEAGQKGGQAKANAKHPSSNATAGLNQPQPHPSNEGTDANASIKSALQAEFDETFWPAYPLKRGKAEALKAFIGARKRTPLDEIMAGVRRYAAERIGQDPAHTKHAQGWLNNARWRDEPMPVHQPMQRATAPPHGKRLNAIETGIARRIRRDEQQGRGSDPVDAELLPPDRPELRRLVGDLGASLRWPDGSGNH